MTESPRIELAPTDVCAVDFVDAVGIINVPIRCRRRVFFSQCPVIVIRNDDGIISNCENSSGECPVHLPEG